MNNASIVPTDKTEGNRAYRGEAIQVGITPLGSGTDGLKDRALPLVAIFSALPPPFGGVTVHIDRLLHLLEKEGITYTLYELAGKRIPQRHVVPCRRRAFTFLYRLLSFPEAVANFHTSSIKALFLFTTICAFRGKKVFLTLHSERPIREYNDLGNRRQCMYRACMLRVARFLCVSDSIAVWLQSIGVASHRITVAPAFLPPSSEEMDHENFPQEVEDFFAAHNLVVGTQCVLFRL